MTNDKARETRQLLEYAKTLRLPHETEIRDAYRHTFPSREFGREPGTEPDRTKLYDSTAIESVTSLVTTTMRLLVPQNRQWCEIRFVSEFLKKNLEAQLSPILSDANEAVFNHFTKSNFYLAFGESMLDAAVAGTACLAFIDIEGKPLTYMSVPVSQVYFTERYDGSPDCVFREHTLTARQVLGRFGRENLAGKYVEDAMERPDKPVQLIEAVIPDGDKYRYCVYDASCWEPLQEGIGNWNPLQIWRWSKTSGEVWGESPLRHGLPHVRMVNAMIKSLVAYGEYAAFGLWQVQDETVNVAALKGRMVPGSVLPIESPLQPVAMPGKFNIGQEMVEDQRAQIRALTHANTAVPTDGRNTYMTREEVVTRREQFYEKIGEPAQRLQYEALQPIAEQTVGRLQLRGELPRVPPELIRQLVPGAKDQRDVFRVEVNAAITKALKLAEAQSDMQTFATAVQAFGAETVMKHVNGDKAVLAFFDKAGFSPDLIRTPKEVAEIEAQQQRMAMAQTAMNLANSPVGQQVTERIIEKAAAA